MAPIVKIAVRVAKLSQGHQIHLLSVLKKKIETIENRAVRIGLVPSFVRLQFWVQIVA